MTHIQSNTPDHAPKLKNGDIHIIGIDIGNYETKGYNGNREVKIKNKIAPKIDIKEDEIENKTNFETIEYAQQEYFIGDSTKYNPDNIDNSTSTTKDNNKYKLLLLATIAKLHPERPLFMQPFLTIGIPVTTFLEDKEAKKNIENMLIGQHVFRYNNNEYQIEIFPDRLLILPEPQGTLYDIGVTFKNPHSKYIPTIEPIIKKENENKIATIDVGHKTTDLLYTIGAIPIPTKCLHITIGTENVLTTLIEILNKKHTRQIKVEQISLAIEKTNKKRKLQHPEDRTIINYELPNGPQNTIPFDNEYELAKKTIAQKIIDEIIKKWDKDDLLNLQYMLITGGGSILLEKYMEEYAKTQSKTLHIEPIPNAQLANAHGFYKRSLINYANFLKKN